MDKFLLFIEKYRERLVKHAFYRVGNLEEAEDIVQDVFVKIYSQKLFCKMENQKAYLYKLTINACVDFIRKQKYKLRVHAQLEAQNQETAENEAIHNLRYEEEFKRINNILKTLPIKQAEVVRYRIIDELSFKEIADIIGKPESTIKSRFQYAINKLKNYEL